MDLLKKLTIKNLKLNKKRTIVTIIGILLSVALITAVATMYSSAIASLIEFEIREKGNFHVAFYDVPMEEVDSITNNRKIDEIYFTQDIGYSELKDSQNTYKPYAFVKGFTKSSLENLSVKLVQGRLPENENEVVIPTHLKTNGRIELNVGDDITLNVGERYSEGNKLNQSNPFNEEIEEEIINTTTKTYKIVGMVERPASNIEGYTAPGYTFITYMDEKDMSNVDVFARYTKEGSKDYINITADILDIDRDTFEKYTTGSFDFDGEEFEQIEEKISKSKYEYNLNSYLIDLETSPLDNNSIGSLGVVVAVVCGIIVFTSVFCIKNSFDISISEKIKQYGMLKSIGATKKQIRKNVFYEATILGVIGIPLGLLSGLIASYILVIVSNFFIGGLGEEGLKLILSLSPIAFVVSIGLGIVTIYLSALRSARKASKISPIESIRNSNEIKINSKKIKSPKIIKKVFGVGGEISYKNLKRNKKKYRTTVISITVSVFVFIALSYFMSLAFDEIKNEIGLRDYNMCLSLYPGNFDETYPNAVETTKLGNINQYSIQKNNSFYTTNLEYTKEYNDLMNIDEEEIYLEDAEYKEYINVKSLNDEQYKAYVKEIGLDYEEMKDKAILINNITISVYDVEKEKSILHNVDKYNCSENDIIKGEDYSSNKFNFEIGAITKVLPFGVTQNGECLLILSEELFDKNFKDNTYVYIYYDSSNADKLQDDIDELLKGLDYNLNNTEENARMMKKLYTLVGIFLYGFIIVITAIGVTNIFNTITTNMELRKPEFAMLKSIGMTTKEFNRMIRLETIFMGVKSLLFSIPIGIGLSYLIYRALEDSGAVEFTIPLKSIIIAIIAVFLLITCIMKYSMNKINKQNTIETIRNENI